MGVPMPKACTQCGKAKNAKNFTRNRSRSDGFAQFCRKCTRVYLNNWAEGHRDQRNRRGRESYSRCQMKIESRARKMLNASKHRAAESGVAFDLSLEWAIERLTAGVCEATAIPFVIKRNGNKEHRTNAFSPSIDRIKQDGPYTMRNCRVVIWIYNRSRGHFPTEDLERMAEAIVEQKRKYLRVA